MSTTAELSINRVFRPPTCTATATRRRSGLPTGYVTRGWREGPSLLPTEAGNDPLLIDEVWVVSRHEDITAHRSGLRDLCGEHQPAADLEVRAA